MPDPMKKLREEQAQDVKCYLAHSRWIEKRFNLETANKANYGWSVDYVLGTYCTKVYGEGILISKLDNPEEMEFDDDL